jgi:hypothetical protein
MAEHQLPEAFADLAPYLAWALPTGRERCAKRRSSTMTEINAFYQAMLPRMDEILSYVDGVLVEDAGTFEKTRSMLTSGAKKEIIVGDEELLIRQHHKVTEPFFNV